MNRSITALALAMVFFTSGAFAQDLLVGRGSPIWQQLEEVVGPLPVETFGASVAVSGNTLVVGAPGASIGCNGLQYCGAAYVYTAPEGNWANLTQVATLTESNGTYGAEFGSSVAISADTIVVAGMDPIAGGAGYLFVEPAGGWTDMTETAELTPAHASGNLLSVAIDGNTVVVGTLEAVSNRAYVFVKPASGWITMRPTAELQPALNINLNNQYGWAVAIAGKSIVVSANNAPLGDAYNVGVAFLFTEPIGGWTGTRRATTEFMPSDGERYWDFGGSVSIFGDTVAIGAAGASIGPNGREGAVYIFSRPAGGWTRTMTETARVTAKNGKAESELGYSVRLTGSRLMTGTLKNYEEGSVVEFSEPASGWQDATQITEIVAFDGAPGNFFGSSITVGSSVLIVGAGGWQGGSHQGAIYSFGLSQ